MSVRHVTSPDGTRIGFETLGAGPPVVAVHGRAADRTRWSAAAPLLAGRFTLALVDRRGRGLSRDEAPGHSLAREAEDLTVVVDSLGREVSVLAHGFGAICAIEAALVCDGIVRLLLYEPPIPVLGLSPCEPEPCAGFADDRVAARETLAAAAYRLDAQRLRGVRAPVRILFGGRSSPTLAAASIETAAALERAELRGVDAWDHAAMVTEPDAFAREVIRFCG